MRARVVYAVIWTVAVVGAVAVGLAAINIVGDSVRGRGPLGSEFDAADAGERWAQRPRPDPEAEVRSRDITGDFGTFVVACQGAYAIGVDARATGTGSWDVVRFEPGPDDDVDAVFSDRTHLVSIEVYCNGGRPTVAEIERSQLGGDDDD